MDLSLENFDNFILSFPKCGRTWLRIALGCVTGCPHIIKKNQLVTNDIYRIPNFPRFCHDDSSQVSKPLEKDKSFYKDKKVVFLTRDPRDVLISYYYQKYYRENYIDTIPPLSEFIRSSYGISRIAEFYSIWMRNKHIPKDFMHVRYEVLHTSMLGILGKVVKFFNFSNIDKKDLCKAIKFSSFKNLHKLEKNRYFLGQPMSRERVEGAAYQSKKEMKIRSGVIGEGYRKISKDDLNYINKILELYDCNLYAR